MKFGKEFASQLVLEWQDAYMNYNSLKRILKDLQIYNQQIAPSPLVSATPRGTLRRRISLYRAFSGLTGRNTNRDQSSTGSVNDDDDQVILVSGGVNDYQQTVFLNSSEGGGGGGGGGEYEACFFKDLDDEFNKVVKFYKLKVEDVMKEAEELSKQMDALIALRIKVDDPSIVAVAANGDSSAPSVSLFVNNKNNRQSGWVQMDVIKEQDGSDEDVPTDDHNHNHNNPQKDKKLNLRTAFRPASLDVLNHVTVNVTPETPIGTLAGLAHLSNSKVKFSKNELYNAEERLKQAFMEFHKLLRVLKSYSFLNILAFSKILKKYDKITSKNASRAYMDKVENSCLASDEISKLIQRVESTFVKHFYNGNHRKGMGYLRPQPKKERHRTTFFLGLLVGCSIALVAAIAVAIHFGQLLNTVNNVGRDKYMQTIFPLYSLFLYIILHMIMYAANIYYWRRFRVNYSFIFGFKQGTELGYREVLLAGSFLSVLTLTAILSNLDMDVRPRYEILTESVPLILLIVAALILICPFNIIYRSSRYFFITSAFHFILAPLYKVTLPDFFLGDQLTSQIQALKSVQFYICYYARRDHTTRENTCARINVFEVFTFVIVALPYWLRTLQCLRRFFEEKNKMEGYNALKYLSTIVAVLARTFHDRELLLDRTPGISLKAVTWATSGIATVYNTYWDIVVDWGLLQRNSKNAWLRDKLLIPEKSVYFLAIVLNMILRLAWMQMVLGIRSTAFLHQTAMIAVVACLEIIRRGIWNFFRLENEHLNNVGKFRAFKSVPLPFNYDDEDGKTR